MGKILVNMKKLILILLTFTALSGVAQKLDSCNYLVFDNFSLADYTRLKFDQSAALTQCWNAGTLDISNTLVNLPETINYDSTYLDTLIYIIPILDRSCNNGGTFKSSIYKSDTLNGVSRQTIIDTYGLKWTPINYPFLFKTR